MSLRAGLVLLLVVAWAAVAVDGGSIGERTLVRAMEDEMLMESEVARRQLGGGGYISYGALQRNNVPCNNRGQSYYNCRNHQQANPYQRSCTMATRCARASR